MTKTGRQMNAQRSHRKVQASSVRSRKSVKRPKVQMKSQRQAQNKQPQKKQAQTKMQSKASIQDKKATQSKMSMQSKASSMQNKTLRHDKTQDKSAMQGGSIVRVRMQNKAPMQGKSSVQDKAIQDKTSMQSKSSTHNESQYEGLVKIKFTKKQPEKIPLGNGRPKMDIVQSHKIRHFAEVSEETVLAEMDQVGRTNSESLALEKALDNFETEKDKIEVAEQPVIQNFDIQHVNRQLRSRRQTATGMSSTPQSAKEIKDQAIQNAMRSVSRQEREFQKKHRARTRRKATFGFKRLLLAFSCAAAAVFAIVYFVDLNSPNVSLKVAAMQSGIDAAYPSYVPRDYSLSDITSEKGKIILIFKNGASGESFSIIEENSAWDSATLLNNYVKPELGEEYTTVKEQGLTLYMTDHVICWVNGGVVYKMMLTNAQLTKKQVKTIATSL